MSYTAWILLMIGSLGLSVGAIAGVLAGSLHERRRWERRLIELSGVLRGGDASSDGARMQRLEHAVDAVAVELERLGEGQRFVTKLLADRASRSPQPGSIPASRTPTP